MVFLGRSGDQPLNVFKFLGVFYLRLPTDEDDQDQDDTNRFLSTTLRNIHRLRSLKIVSESLQLEWVLGHFSKSAPELKHLTITNDPEMTEREVKLPNTLFEGRLPKLTSLELHHLRSNLRVFTFPSLTRFHFTTETITPVRDLTSFFERCPLLESVEISLLHPSQPPTTPPRERVRLVALKELKLDQIACTTGLLDHLILPQCTELTLKGQFTGEALDQWGDFAAQIHPSSIDHLPVTRGITKGIAVPYSCILSGPNGNLRFWFFDEIREDFTAEYFTSLSPISVLDIRELWVGQRGDTAGRPWEQTAERVLGAFKALTKVEDLAIVRCETEAFFTALGSTMDDVILLPGLRRLTIYVGSGDLDVKALVQCAKTRKEHFRPIEEVDVVLGRELDASFVQETESLREFVGQLSCRVGKAPKLDYNMEDIPGCKVGLR